MPDTKPATLFSIDYKGKVYAGQRIENRGSILYVIKFTNSLLCLTKARMANGGEFWTAVPADTKLNHVVQELGQKIDAYFK